MVMIVLVLIKTNLSMRKLWQRENVQIAEPSPPKPPKEPTFSCPICMGPLVEEMTTKCGHIFCKSCIKAAITVQGKCPTCRRKVTARDIHRVYLPTTNWTRYAVDFFSLFVGMHWSFSSTVELADDFYLGREAGKVQFSSYFDLIREFLNI